MPERRRYRGDQFLLTYKVDVSKDSVLETVAGQTRVLGAELKILLSTSTTILIKTTTPLDFRGEHHFIIKKNLPEIELIKGKDRGLTQKLAEMRKDKHTSYIDNYTEPGTKILRQEAGGYMSRIIANKSEFDPVTQTKFGTGHRRTIVTRDKDQKITGYKLIPFREYTPEWASDIYGYDSFEDALKDIYPYQIQDLRILKEMYMSRPRSFTSSKMVPTYWQRKVLEILDIPPNYDAQKREFYWFIDFVGGVGKSMLINYIQSTRDDCLVISSLGKMADLVMSVKEPLMLSSKINNIILDIPREIIEDDVSYDTLDDRRNNGELYKFMESCTNGRLTSTKYESANLEIGRGLNVVVLTNSLPLITATSLDRWRIYLIKDQNDLQIEDLRYTDKARISTKREALEFFMKEPRFIEYLENNGIKPRSSRRFQQSVAIP